MSSSWFLYRAGATANGVTLFALFLALGASLWLIYPSWWGGVIGALLFNFVALLDCIDGNIARAKGGGGAGGEWIDALLGYTVYAVLPLAVGLRVDLANATEFMGGFVLVGALASAGNLYTRVIYQKYRNVTSATADDMTESPRQGILNVVSGNIGLVGFMMPFLLLAVIAEYESWFLIFYAAVYTASAVAVAVILLRKLTS